MVKSHNFLESIVGRKNPKLPREGGKVLGGSKWDVGSRLRGGRLSSKRMGQVFMGRFWRKRKGCKGEERKKGDYLLDSLTSREGKSQTTVGRKRWRLRKENEPQIR